MDKPVTIKSIVEEYTRIHPVEATLLFPRDGCLTMADWLRQSLTSLLDGVVEEITEDMKNKYGSAYADGMHHGLREARNLIKARLT